MYTLNLHLFYVSLLTTQKIKIKIKTQKIDQTRNFVNKQAMCQNTLIDSLLNFHCLYNFNTKGEFCKEKKCREEMEKEENDGLWVLYNFYLSFFNTSYDLETLWVAIFDLIPFVLLSHFFIINKYHFFISFLIFDLYVFNCENREVG